MGLIKEAKHLRKVREFESMVQEVFGKSVEEIKKILDSRYIVVPPAQPKVDESVVAGNKEKAKEKMTPEDMIAMFAQETEEFYPDGNAPQH